MMELGGILWLNSRKTTGRSADYPDVQEVVELGLRNLNETSQGHSAGPLKSTAEAFLKAFADFAPEAEDKDTSDFKRELQEVRAQLGMSSHEQDVRRLAASGVKICEQFLKRSRHYYQAREAEFAEMISILREMGKRLAGDSTEFDAQMQATAARFRGLVQLNDIRELKRNLAEQVNVLERTIAEKKQRDQQRLTVLTEKVQTLQANLSEAEELASIDPLTNAANRGAFDRALPKMIAASRTGKTPLALAMIDIDHFKQINDTHGHPIGDRVLRCAAQWLAGAVRHADLVARYGGEEFAILMADADLAAATARLQSVIKEIADRSFEYEAAGETRSIRFTVSCGVAQLTGGEADRDLVQRADQALYEAKHSGRNRVVARKRSMIGSLFS